MNSAIAETTIELSSGQSIDVRLAVSCFESLKSDLEYHPEEFRALVAFASGKPSRDADGIYREMREAGIILEDNSVNPAYKAILQCSLRESESGFQLVPPYREDSPDDKQKWETEARHFRDELLKLYATTQNSPSPRGTTR
ncbi:MAG TPA: hypothetical protein VE988_10285 [Gemmataceae bacterium]|nr:hypothetical protein [Gemmataceae bacterium]